MKKVQKYAFSLLELVIATAITAVLLGVLWNTYYSWSKGYKELHIKQNHLHKTVFLKQRLELISSHLCSQSKENKLFSLHKKGESPRLMLTYKAGPDLSPEFNGVLLAQLFLDEKGTLSFVTKGREGSIRKEVLRTGNSSMALSFFDPKSNAWEDEWDKEKGHLPLWVKISLKNREKEEVFYLRSSLLKEPILYLEQIEGPL